MKLKINLNAIKGWNPKKTIAKNIGDILCGASQDINHHHSQACFKNYGTQEENKALEKLFSDESLGHIGDAYLSRVVEPIFESLPSHNGSEPSLLYSLLQHAVRQSTNRLRLHVEADQIRINHQKERLEDLATQPVFNKLGDSKDIYQTILAKKSELEELRTQNGAVIAAIQAVSIRSSKLPLADNLSKPLSKEAAALLKQSYDSRLSSELAAKKSDYESLMTQVCRNATEYLDKQEKITEAHNWFESMKDILASVNEYAEQVKVKPRLTHKVQLRFFSKSTSVIVCQKGSEKDFSWEGSKGLCENLQRLLGQYISSSGHSSDRLKSANKIYDKVNKLLTDKILPRIERDKQILDIIREESISSKGRWTGVTSQLFVIYRTAEYAHREHLKNVSEKIMSPKLEDLDAKVEGMERLQKLLKDIENLRKVMDDSQEKLNDLREIELSLVMNADDRSRDDDLTSTPDTQFKNAQRKRLSELRETEKAINLCRLEGLETSLKSSKLAVDTQETITGIRIVYKRLCEITFEMRAQRKVDFPSLSDDDSLTETEMLENASTYFKRLEALSQTHMKVDSEAQDRNANRMVGVF